MITAAKRKRSAPSPDLRSEYRKANERALKRADSIMAGEPDPGPLMTLEDDGELVQQRDNRRVGQPSGDPPRGAVGKLARGPKAVGLDDSTHPTATANEPRRLERIPIEFLGASPWQPRTEFDSKKLEELAHSIQLSGGNITPCIVWPVSGSYIVEHTTKGNGKKLPQYFVLAGERRLRACQWGAKHGLPCCGSLTCEVFDAKASDAERLARMENLHREDLGPIDAIRNLKAMLDAGLYETQQQLALAVGLTPAALSNQLRVLELPTEWLDLVSQEKLTPTHLRCLVPWKDRPTVLAEARRELNENYDWGLTQGDNPRMPTVHEWEEAVAGAVIEVSRPVIATKNFYESHEVRKKGRTDVFRIEKDDVPSPKEIEAVRSMLDIVEVPNLGERAFNVEAWDKLSEAVKRHRAAKAGAEEAPKTRSAEGGQPTKKLTAAEQRAKAKEAGEQFAKRLYRYRISWLQKRIIEQLADAPAATLLTHLLAFAAADGHGGLSRRHHEFGEAVITCGGVQKAQKRGWLKSTDVWASLATLAKSGEGIDLVGLARTTLTTWYAHDFENSSTDTSPEFLEGAALQLGIDLAEQWTLDREFLELHTKEQLVELWKEWKLSLTKLDLDSAKKSLLIDEILNHFDAGNPKLRANCPLPKFLAKLKPCSI